MSTLKKRIEKKHWCSCANVNVSPFFFILIVIIYDVTNGSFERDQHECEPILLILIILSHDAIYGAIHSFEQ